MNKSYNAEVEAIRKEVFDIVNGIYKANETILLCLENCESTKLADTKKYIKNVGTRTLAIDNQIIKLFALHGPEAKDLRELAAFLKITNELFRASSNTRSYIKGLSELPIKFEIKNVKEYSIAMQTSTTKALKLVCDIMNMDCADEINDAFNEVLIEENKTDNLYEMIEKEFFNQSNSEEDLKKFHLVLRILRKSEKIADRASSIAGLLKFARVGGHLEQ